MRSVSSRPLLSRSGCIYWKTRNTRRNSRIVLVPFYRGAVVFYSPDKHNYSDVLFSSPFIEERLYLVNLKLIKKVLKVLVPFYRGAVVFLRSLATLRSMATLFSSPFIEERLYFDWLFRSVCSERKVLVPFYRGAVVFGADLSNADLRRAVLVPFYRGAVVFRAENGTNRIYKQFSSPFIEERLYLSC